MAHRYAASSLRQIICKKTFIVLLVCSALFLTGCNTPVRFASFNASMYRANAGDLAKKLATPGSAQPAAIAEIIQRVRPDVLLINEFDYDEDAEAVKHFRNNYLNVSQNGQTPIDYPYACIVPSNTGIASGFDLNNDGVRNAKAGTREYGSDAFGYGVFPGQYAFVIYSKYPLDTQHIRTFQHFRWAQMPGNLLNEDPSLGDSNLRRFYSDAEREALRLSSKNHVDLSVTINGHRVHLLCAHPTPPGFDGDEDRNGKRNHDEIRLWADYIDPAKSGYLIDDDGRRGGLYEGAKFVILGDYNADPYDGSSRPGAAEQLLDHPLIHGSTHDPAITPASQGGVEQDRLQGRANLKQRGNPAFDTADFGDGSVGNLRVDYALPSANMVFLGSGVFWPESSDPAFPATTQSDHRLVYVDVLIEP